jgi:hypothetical protein
LDSGVCGTLDAFDADALGVGLGVGFTGAFPKSFIKLFCFGAVGLGVLGGMVVEGKSSKKCGTRCLTLYAH